jgi:hypothetical protein
MMEKAAAPDPILLETVPQSERLPRSQLTAIANQYFAAIEQGNGKSLCSMPTAIASRTA